MSTETIKRIVCAVDESVYSGGTVRRALALGHLFGAPVCVMTVREEGAARWDRRPGAEQESVVHGNGAARLAHFAYEASSIWPSSARVVVGRVVPAILETAMEEGADLLVVGKFGPPRGLRSLLLSPITERIVDRSPIPVYAVAGRRPECPGPPELKIRQAVCAVDRSRASRVGMQYAAALSARTGAKLTVVHVLEDMNEEDPLISAGHFTRPECWREVGPEIKASYARLLAEQNVLSGQAELLLPVGKGAQEILRISAESGADLLVLGATGRRGGRRTTRNVLRQASCDVLAMPEPSSTVVSENQRRGAPLHAVL